MSTRFFDFYSWTLKEDTASFFAYRYSQYGSILKRNIRSIDAVDYLTDRGEEEILYQPPKSFLKIMLNASGVDE